jgi:pyruvate/2-oxoglutarate dehydrogenase complex dihydrolipoamide dehydrogenase (E3) component
VQSEDRILPRDHPASSRIVLERLRAEDVDVRLGVRGVAVRRGGPGRILDLSDGTTAEGAEIVVAIGRRPASLRELGAEEAGVVLDVRGGAAADERMSIGDAVFVAGDAAGGMQFTHLADYEGRIAARVALGEDARADLSAVPRTTFTDPETGAVGMTVEEAEAGGIDAIEHTADFATSARGFTLESATLGSYPVDGADLRRGAPGHVTVVVDRERGVLVGAFAAGPAASEFIHAAVVAIRHRIPVPALADTIHAFPTGARVFGNLVAEVAARLGASAGCTPPR